MFYVFPLSTIMIFKILLLLVVDCTLSYAAKNPLDVVLLEFVVAGNQTTTSLQQSGALLDIAYEELNEMHQGTLNFSVARMWDSNVTTCESLEQKATFWATRYFYQDNPNNPVLGIFGPGCPVPATSMGHLARAWKKPLIIPIAGDNAIKDKSSTKFPTLTRVSPYIQDDFTAFLGRLLASFSFSNIALFCDDFGDKLTIFVPICTTLPDDLQKPPYNMTVRRTYFNISQNGANSTNLPAMLAESKFYARGMAGK